MIHILIKNIDNLIILLLIGLVLTACKDQDEMFRQYVTEGGIVYPGKAENVIAKAGVERVYISWPNNYESVTKAGIWWNNNSDSLLVDISPDIDTVRQAVAIPEGIYSFIIRTFDKYGNSSVPVEVIGRSIGEKYMSNFYNRSIGSFKTKGGNNLILEWDDADVKNGALFCEVIYTASDNSEKTIISPATEKLTEIGDHKAGTIFKYRTVYQPDPENDLKIETNYKEINSAYLLLDKSIGKVIDKSSTYPNNTTTLEAGAYDGKYEKSRWHSNTTGYPHYVTIDLGAETTISRFVVWPSTYDNKPDKRMPSVVRLEVSLDNVTWTSAGDYNYDYDPTETNWNARDYMISPVKARYARVKGLDDPSASKVMCLGEIDFYSLLGDQTKPLTPQNPWEKDLWNIISYSSDWQTNLIKNVFDGTRATYWHSEPFDTSKNGMPQWFVVDMKKERPIINGFKIWNRQDDHGLEPKHIRFSVSNDNVTWSPILDLAEMSNTWATELDYPTVGKIGGRYLKVEVLSNWSGGKWTYIAEITPY